MCQGECVRRQPAPRAPRALLNKDWWSCLGPTCAGRALSRDLSSGGWGRGCVPGSLGVSEQNLRFTARHKCPI